MQQSVCIAPALCPFFRAVTAGWCAVPLSSRLPQCSHRLLYCYSSMHPKDHPTTCAPDSSHPVFTPPPRSTVSPDIRCISSTLQRPTQPSSNFQQHLNLTLDASSSSSGGSGSGGSSGGGSNARSSSDGGNTRSSSSSQLPRRLREWLASRRHHTAAGRVGGRRVAPAATLHGAAARGGSSGSESGDSSIDDGTVRVVIGAGPSPLRKASGAPLLAGQQQQQWQHLPPQQQQAGAGAGAGSWGAAGGFEPITLGDVWQSVGVGGQVHGAPTASSGRAGSVAGASGEWVGLL